MDFPFEPGKRAREQTTLRAGFPSQHLRVAGIGRAMRGKSAIPRLKCLLLPLS